ncbi:MAG: arylesterase [Pseudomonadota bacterium]
MNLILKVVLLLATLTLSSFAQAANNILVFGDSLSAGYGIAREASWAHLLQQELTADGKPYTVINASISGETTAGGLRRIDRALKEHRPAIVILELGANDGLRGSPLTEMEKNLDTIIRRAKHANAKVLLLGMQLPPNYGPVYTKQFHDIYPRLAIKHRIALLPFMLDGIPAEQFQADNLHPNAVAQSQILGNLRPYLNRLLHR